MEKKPRKPTEKEFLDHIAELEKQNLYGGAVDTVSPMLVGALSGQGTKALIERNPIPALALSLFGNETGDYIGGPQTQKINDKALSPDMKYVKSLAPGIHPNSRESRVPRGILATKEAIERLKKFKK